MKKLSLMLLSVLATPVLARDKPPPAPVARPPAVSVDGLPVGSIPRQSLPDKGCAAFLWTLTPSHALVAMVTAEPAQLRMTIDGSVADFVRTAQVGAGGFGFSQTSEFRGGDVTATLDMTVATRGDLAGGAAVPEATLRLDRPGKDTLVLPVAGLIGCS
ncbi:hypothetical protein [uncultured Sphingomonas sp.]|uniref:hypothetical protein n=1 Tax=uncultured Sphingomonas sp. TaxID=158754 RepID=UPI0035CA270E